MRKDKFVTRKQIVEETGLSMRTVDRAISDLSDRNVVKRQGSRKTGMWIVREQGDLSGGA